MSLIESYFKEKEQQKRQSSLALEGFGFLENKPFVEVKFKSGFIAKVYISHTGVELWNGANEGVKQSVKNFIIENKFELKKHLKPNQSYKDYLELTEKIRELQTGERTRRETAREIALHNYKAVYQGWQ